MPMSVVQKSLQVFSALGITDLRLTGGEPTVHPQFRAIVKVAVDAGFKVRMISNGIRPLRDEWLPVMSMISKTWISVYGLDSASHQLVGGSAAKPLTDTIRDVVTRQNDGHWIGISAVISPSDSAHLESFINQCHTAGIKRLRFIPLEPDGRAQAISGVGWGHWPNEIAALIHRIEAHPLAQRFEVLSVSNLFDHKRGFATPRESCALKERQMWAVVPNGDVYPCCFTAYSAENRVTNILEPGWMEKMSPEQVFQNGSSTCRGLNTNYWSPASIDRVSCPVRVLNFHER